jgi:hypothetical protein
MSYSMSGAMTLKLVKRLRGKPNAVPRFYRCRTVVCSMRSRTAYPVSEASLVRASRGSLLDHCAVAMMRASSRVFARSNCARSYVSTTPMDRGCSRMERGSSASCGVRPSSRTSRPLRPPPESGTLSANEGTTNTGLSDATCFA